MIRIAITGHRGLPDPTRTLVDAALRSEINRLGERGLVGVSCLADGADALFAQAVLDSGGDLVAVLPARGYRERLPADYHPTFDALLERAAEVITLDYDKPGSAAYMAASVRMVQGADHLVAVWDGQPAAGQGGTADVVTHARGQGLPVTVIWPEGSSRG
ncbi:hypothetical protein GCM10010174_56990 [Kutzneria viridogrisea]|uniref:Secreted protein n=2 Tax=Kutzneria TaxID=43356 RepID=W5WA01_9PSEU|nr:hypothetical protein [Kutzneria albida]AHH95034.1 hypothetical protein KALB_1662 [Kutzneria albida DSM 43870]MBA8927610.1 putative Rossmann fold nucleotide-binding protein DprA/Smf involved in DNA uptake [Kutzneria viridogrisea]